MHRQRKKFFIMIITVLFVVFCLLSGAAATIDYTAKTIMDIPLYKEASYNSEKVLEIIKQNEPLDIVGETVIDENGVSWIKVVYNSYYEGYIPSAYLYLKPGAEDYDIIVVKATGKSMSDEIKIYRHYDENSEVVAVLHDGEKINLIEEQDEIYGDFRKVVYNGEFCFVKAENITTGLTYNQTLAVIISCGLVAIIICVVLLSVYVSRKKRGIIKNK